MQITINTDKKINTSLIKEGDEVWVKATVAEYFPFRKDRQLAITFNGRHYITKPEDKIVAHFPAKQEKYEEPDCIEEKHYFMNNRCVHCGYKIKSIPQQDRIEPLDLSRIDKHDTIKLADKINELIAHNNQRRD